MKEKKCATYSLTDTFLDTVETIHQELEIPKSEILELALESFCKNDLEKLRKEKLSELNLKKRALRESIKNSQKQEFVPSGTTLISSDGKRIK